MIFVWIERLSTGTQDDFFGKKNLCTGTQNGFLRLKD